MFVSRVNLQAVSAEGYYNGNSSDGKIASWMTAARSSAVTPHVAPIIHTFVKHLQAVMNRPAVSTFLAFPRGDWSDPQKRAAECPVVLHFMRRRGG